MTTSSTKPCRLVVLISGRGSNMQTIVNTAREPGVNAQVCAVLANKPDAGGLQWAQSQGIPVQAVPHRNYPTRDAFDAALMQAIDAYEPDYVLLAGFMRVLTPGFVEHYNGRLINIHPSLLPAFPGLHTHQQALAMGVQWHGCTIHFVTPVLDHGPVIAQGVVPVLAADTPDDLAGRLLKVEHTMYGHVVQWLAQGRVSLDAMQRVHVRGLVNRSFVLGPQGVVSPEYSS